MGAAIPLTTCVSDTSAADSTPSFFKTGCPQIDRALGGGLRHGTLLVVIGSPGSGKSDFLIRLAKSNGIVDAHAMNRGASDMLSISRRPDGQYIGSIVLNCVEPTTEQDRLSGARDPTARDAFLSRWFKRSKDILRESGGIFALTVEAQLEGGMPHLAAWTAHPDYIVQAEGHTYRLIKPAGGGHTP